MTQIVLTPARATALYNALAVISGTRQDLSMPNMYIKYDQDNGTYIKLIDDTAIEALSAEGFSVINNDDTGVAFVLLDR